MTKQKEIETIRENVPSSDSPLERLVIRQPQSIALNEDCMEVMKRYPDKFFALAIVDPPYGIGDGTITAGNIRKSVKYKKSKWNSAIPPKKYFKELRRVSQNQIIWGGNYFPLPPTRCFIVWYKEPAFLRFAPFEFAWTSFDRIPALFHYRYTNIIHRDYMPIHPTQKPIALYDWLLSTYAEKGQNVIDTHLGSGGSRIACHKAGLDFLGMEIDKDYFEAQEKRFGEYFLQLPMQFAAV